MFKLSTLALTLGKVNGRGGLYVQSISSTLTNLGMFLDSQFGTSPAVNSVGRSARLPIPVWQELRNRVRRRVCHVALHVGHAERQQSRGHAIRSPPGRFGFHHQVLKREPKRFLALRIVVTMGRFKARWFDIGHDAMIARSDQP